MKTNHIMVHDERGYFYCKLQNKNIFYGDGYFKNYCHKCYMLNGLGGGIGAVECLYDDGSNNISIQVSSKKIIRRRIK